jgi:AraC family transcriptional regulator, regulatory protein of adaptative response / methylated-DNA-[protein]-cysteine methyltransferase
MASKVTAEARLPLLINSIENSTATRLGDPCAERPNACDAIRFAIGKSSLGMVIVGVTAKGVCAILFGESAGALPRILHDCFPAAQLVGSDDELRPVLAKVIRFIEAPALGLDLPLDLRGTPFQRQVWQALREIPAGCTASYTEIAERIGAPNEAFAVGEACAANPIAVAIPCHRVVRKSGALAGYRWGFKRKRALLAREAADGNGLPLFHGIISGDYHDD